MKEFSIAFLSFVVIILSVALFINNKKPVVAETKPVVELKKEVKEPKKVKRVHKRIKHQPIENKVPVSIIEPTNGYQPKPEAPCNSYSGAWNPNDPRQPKPGQVSPRIYNEYPTNTASANPPTRYLTGNERFRPAQPCSECR